MADNFKGAMNDEELEAVAGGQTTDPYAGHWQDVSHKMGTDFYMDGYRWYRIKTGDTLGQIAKKYGVTLENLFMWNRKTIQNENMIFAGDTIIVAPRT